MRKMKVCPKCGDKIPIMIPRNNCPKCGVPYEAEKPKKKPWKKKVKP